MNKEIKNEEQKLSAVKSLINQIERGRDTLIEFDRAYFQMEPIPGMLSKYVASKMMYDSIRQVFEDRGEKELLKQLDSLIEKMYTVKSTVKKRGRF